MKKGEKARIVLCCIICCIILAGITLSRVGGQEKEGQRWALVIGVNDYMKNVTPLRCAVNDANYMANALQEISSFPEQNVIVLSSDQRDLHIPTKVNIAKWISYIRSQAGPEDSFVFFFSGHGVQMDEEGYLLTFEADPYSEETLDASCLSLSDIAKYFKKIKTSKIVLFIDACRDDPRTDSQSGARSGGSLVGSKAVEGEISKPEGSTNNPLKDTFSRALIIDPKRPDAPAGGNNLSATFFSCKVGQRSYEWREYTLGFFTYFVLKGIWGAAADPDGNVTMSALDSYLGKEVSRAVELERRSKQEPMVVINGSEVARAWPLASMKGLTASQKKPPEVLSRPTFSGQEVAAKGEPVNKGLNGLALKPKEPGSRVTYAIDVIVNTVQGRTYDELTHRIEQNLFEISKDTIRKEVSDILNQTGIMEQAGDGSKADMWVFLNVCPTSEMSVDLMVKDCRTGSFFSKQNVTFYRPYPGKERQLRQYALKTVREKFLDTLVAKVKSRYF